MAEIDFLCSDPQSGGDTDPPVQADGATAGGQEAVPVRHDAAVQQQPREPTDRAADVRVAGVAHRYCVKIYSDKIFSIVCRQLFIICVIMFHFS